MEKEVKGTGRMKEVLIKVVMLSAVIVLSIINCNGYANANTISDKNGVEVEVTTDKDEYKTDEVIKGNVSIVNNSDSVITGVTYTPAKLAGYDITVEKETSKHYAYLKNGESISYEVIFNPSKAVNSIEDEKVPLDGGESGISDNHNTLNTKDLESEAGEMDEVPQTDSGMSAGMFVILTCSGIVLVIFVAKKLKGKYDRRYIAYLLIFGIMGSLLQPAMTGRLSAKADETKKPDKVAEDNNTDEGSNTVDTTYVIIIDGEEVALKGQISYKEAKNSMSDESDSEENEQKESATDDKNDVDKTYTVTFDLGYKGASAPTKQSIQYGECATEPEKPDRKGFVFIGWYEEGKEYPNMYLADMSPVKDDITLTAKWIDVKTDADSDGDGITDGFETIILTDKDSKDTDGDGLEDGTELVMCTSPLALDSDKNGIKDCDEDSDDDGLANLDEMSIGTDPSSEDTDADGLKDGEEVNILKTNPLKQDTDGDGADDKTEKGLGTNPVKSDEYFDVVRESDEEDTVKASVAIKLKGEQLTSLSVERVYNDVIFSEKIPGYLGGAYDFGVDGTFENATLIFEFDESLVGSKDFEPVIYYYNEEEQEFEPLETTVKGNIASARTTHFSIYMLIDKRMYDRRFEWINVWEEEEYSSVEIIFLIDDSSRMLVCDPHNERLEFVKRTIDMLPSNCKIGIGKMGAGKELVTSGLTSDKNTAKSYLTNEYFKSKGISWYYTPINNGLDKFESMQSNNLRVLVVMADRGSNDGYMLKSRAYSFAKKNNIKIHTVGLSEKKDNENSFKSTHMDLALSTGGQFYYAPAGTLNDKTLDIGLDMDRFKDNDNDGIPNLQEENMYLFNGIPIPLDKDNPDTDGDGIIDSLELKDYHVLDEEGGTRMAFVAHFNSDPTKTDSDGDGLYDNTVRAVEKNGELIIIAPKDTQPLTPNGPKGMWDKHVETYLTTDIPTEYGENVMSAEEAQEALCDYVENFIQEKIMDNISEIPGIGSYLEEYIVDYIMKVYVEEYTEEIIEITKEEVEDNFAQHTADNLVETLLYLRDTVNNNPEIAETIADFFESFIGIEYATEMGAAFLRFVPDEQGVAYHSKPNTWQRKFGYNIFYDELFSYGSKMNFERIFFDVNGMEYALWMWKGDYWNLGSGAEIGLYHNPDEIAGVYHYDVIDFELPMTLGLYNYYSEDDIECVFNWAPRIKQWWVTGFNPEFDEPDCNNMVVIGSVDFEGREEMYEGLRKRVNKEKKNSYYVFDEDGHTVWIIWDKKE